MNFLQINFFIIISICALLSCKKERYANSVDPEVVVELRVYVLPDYLMSTPKLSIESLKSWVLYHTVDDKKVIRELAEQIGQLHEKEESIINIEVLCEFVLVDGSKRRLIFHHFGTIEWEGNSYKPDPDLLQILEQALPEDYSNNRDYEYRWRPTPRGK